MARKNELKKTKYPNIYEVITVQGDIEYLATWSQHGRQYFQKNLTKIYGCTTAKQASNKLNEIKVAVNKGEDPFRRENSDKNKLFSNLALEEIQSRNVSKDYKYIQEKIFKKHLYEPLKHLKLEQIDIQVLSRIFTALQKTEKRDTIDNLKKTIRPTLDRAVDEGLIPSNPLNSLRIRKLTKTIRKGGKAPLKHRLLGRDNERYLNIAKALYNAALNFTQIKGTEETDRELQLAFLLVTMTGRRRNEVLNIKYEDITTYQTVKTNPDTTKTDVWEEYPLPQEVIDRLKKNASGKILPNITPKKYSYHLRKLIDSLKLPVHVDMKIDGHDTRNLFLTIMSKETKNPFLCDSAISHDQSKYPMLLKYYEPDINDYTELFEHYWDLIRGDRKLEGRQ